VSRLQKPCQLGCRNQGDVARAFSSYDHSVLLVYDLVEHGGEVLAEVGVRGLVRKAYRFKRTAFLYVGARSREDITNIRMSTFERWRCADLSFTYRGLVKSACTIGRAEVAIIGSARLFRYVNRRNSSEEIPSCYKILLYKGGPISRPPWIAPLVAASLPLTFESKARGRPAKLVRPSARHERLLSCRRGVRYPLRGTHPSMRANTCSNSARASALVGINA
jgi:hypothetical protein